MISRSEFDSHAAKLRHKYEAQLEQGKAAQRELAAQLEELKKNPQLSDEERADYDSRIDQLRSNYETKAEAESRKAAAKQNELQGALDEMEATAVAWQQRYQQAVATSNIASAAVDHKAVSATQLERMVMPMTEWQPVLDEDGQPTGDVQPIVKFPTKDKKDKPVVLDLPIKDAVKLMKELPEYGNLFTDTRASGTANHGSSGHGKGLNLAKLAKENPAEFNRLRKEEPDKFYAAANRG